jgi:hypothetical protein
MRRDAAHEKGRSPARNGPIGVRVQVVRVLRRADLSGFLAARKGGFCGNLEGPLKVNRWSDALFPLSKRF